MLNYKCIEKDKAYGHFIDNNVSVKMKQIL